jgi:hypothetical protein
VRAYLRSQDRGGMTRRGDFASCHRSHDGQSKAPRRVHKLQTTPLFMTGLVRFAVGFVAGWAARYAIASSRAAVAGIASTVFDVDVMEWANVRSRSRATT